MSNTSSYLVSIMLLLQKMVYKFAYLEETWGRCVFTVRQEVVPYFIIQGRSSSTSMYLPPTGILNHGKFDQATVIKVDESIAPPMFPLCA